MKYPPVWLLAASCVAFVILAIYYAPSISQINAKHAAWETLVAELKVDEGLPGDSTYKDTRGVETIGYGTDIAEGITKIEADWLLRHRLLGNAGLPDTRAQAV